MATTYTATYEGYFGENSAGANGLDITQTGNPLPAFAQIIDIKYSIEMAAGGYSSSKKWCVHHFYLENGTPYAKYKEVSMNSHKQTVTGSMEFDSSDARIFDGSVQLYAKVNTTHSSASTMDKAVITVSYQLTYGQSDCELSPSTLEAGKTMEVLFANGNLDAVYHQVIWKFGTKSKTEITLRGASSVSYQIPLTWLGEIPSSPSGKGTVEVTTYAHDGTLEGISTYDFTLEVPETVVPSITGIEATRVDNSVPADWGIYVQNRSGVILTAKGATGIYGSEISSYRFSVDGASTQNYNAQSGNVFVLSPIMLSGAQTFSVYAIDSRGRQSPSVSCSITVTAYTPPTLKEALAFRCDESGTPYEEGTYIGVKASGEYSSLGGKNSLSISCRYQRVGAAEWADGVLEMIPGQTYVIGDGGIGTNYTYSVNFLLTDKMVTVERIIDVNTTQYTMFYRKGGTGIGFGKVCENDYRIEINPDWGVFHGQDNLIEQIKQASSSPKIVCSEEEPEGKAGTIWLKIMT